MRELCYVYVLQADNGRLYAGITKDLTHRLEQHNAGRCTSTAGRTWRILWSVYGLPRYFARIAESYLQKRITCHQLTATDVENSRLDQRSALAVECAKNWHAQRAAQPGPLCVTISTFDEDR